MVIKAFSPQPLSLLKAFDYLYIHALSSAREIFDTGPDETVQFVSMFYVLWGITQSSNTAQWRT